MMGNKRSWKDLSNIQRIRVVLLGIVQFALLAAALWDLRHRPDDQINGSKRAWMGIIFINYFGPIAYFLFGRKRLE
jgi:drug/metabolite transporter (DMT)-like permease